MTWGLRLCTWGARLIATSLEWEPVHNRGREGGREGGKQER